MWYHPCEVRNLSFGCSRLMRLSVLINNIFVYAFSMAERLSVVVRRWVESLSSCHFCSSFWILVLLSFRGRRSWCTSSSSSPFCPQKSTWQSDGPVVVWLWVFTLIKLDLTQFVSQNDKRKTPWTLHRACQSDILLLLVHSQLRLPALLLLLLLLPIPVKEGGWEETLVVGVMLTPSLKRVAFSHDWIKASRLCCSALSCPPGALTEQKAFPLFHPDKLSFKTQETSAAISFARAQISWESISCSSNFDCGGGGRGGRQSVASALIWTVSLLMFCNVVMLWGFVSRPPSVLCPLRCRADAPLAVCSWDGRGRRAREQERDDDERESQSER